MGRERERERERERAGSVEVNLCLNRETDRGDNRKTFGSLSKDYPGRKERGKEGRKDICGGLSLFPSVQSMIHPSRGRDRFQSGSPSLPSGTLSPKVLLLSLSAALRATLLEILA